MSADRNLLFAILAVQMDFITRDQLIAGLNAWVLAKTKPIGSILEEQGALLPANRRLLEPLVDAHVQAHGGDPEKSLAAVSLFSSLREQLRAVPDADVQATLSFVGCHDEETQSHTKAPTNDRDGSRYRILRPHARGGLGEVFVATDVELNREVALKEIQATKDRGDSRARFVFEAEVTGGLEHPGIVPVYGLGHYDDGRPYYAMRFIKGDNLGEAIKRFHSLASVEASARREVENQNHVDLTDRRSPKFDSVEFRRLLQRFIDVCNAVAYAHSRGVLHRDLKPGNIMLGKYGETLVVDWGLAKTQANRESHRSEAEGEITLKPSSGSDVIPTLHGSALGTPAYMSPEQAAGKLDQLGPATDVYSLGATLYHLLVGNPANSDCDVMATLIRSQKGEIPPPRSIQPAIPKALDAICNRAMALKTSDRYATAQTLAADIEHWLADEPVGAHAEPLSDRARRWLRKHRTFATSAALVGLTTIVGLAIGLAAVDHQRQLVVAQEIATGNERDRAEDEKRIAQAVLSFVENNIFAAARPETDEGGLGHDITLRKAIEAALPFVDKSFTQQPLIEAKLRMTLGISFSYLGDAKIAAEQFQAARALRAQHLGPDHADTLRSMMGLATSYTALGQLADATKLGEETLALMKTKLGSDDQDTLGCMGNLANSYVDLGRHAEALRLREETLAIMKAKLGPDHPDTLSSMTNLAISYDDLGRHSEAIKLHEESLAIMKTKFGPNHPDTFSNMISLAICNTHLGRHVEALKLQSETLALQKAKLGPDHRDTLMTMNNLATSYFNLGRYAEACKLRDETLGLQKSKLGTDHPDTLTGMNNLANSYADLGRHAEALKLREETLALRKAKLGPDHSDTLISMWCLVESLVGLDRGAEAVPIIDDCLKRAAGKIVHPQLIPTVMDLRLRPFEKAKDAAGCRVTAEMWEKLNRADAASLYQAVCNRAVTAAVLRANPPGADATRLADADADQAMGWLHKAVAAGYNNVEHIKRDKDLDALREREDFKKLLADLGAKVATEKKPAAEKK